MELHHQFEEITSLIKAARLKVFHDANRTVIGLYWGIGHYIFDRTQSGTWGKSVVKKLAEHLSVNLPNPTGFSAQNLWRMKQFFEAYHQAEKLSPLVREISWTNNLLILSGTKSEEDKALLRSKPHEFYEISLLGKSI